MSVEEYKQALSLASIQHPIASAEVSNDSPAPISASTLPNETTHNSTDVTLKSDGNGEEELGAKVSFVDITDIREEGADRSSVCLTSKRIQAPKQKQQWDKYGENGLVLRRKYEKKAGKSEEPKFKWTQLEINDEVLRNFIQHALCDYPFVNLSSTPIVIKSPYKELFYYREELRAYITSSERTSFETERLQLLKTFMTENLESTQREYDRHILYGYATWDLLWTLYRPHSLVVTHRNNIYRCFQVKSFDNSVLDCYYWSYIEGRFGRVLHRIPLEPFEGLRKITSLFAVPLNFLPDEQRKCLTEFLIKRGKKWESLCCTSHKTYNGQSARRHAYNTD
ncbi:MAG: hypothetical protein OHK93_005029 [Ramalina farinacea]|uniref:DUF7025 domain-containing protein n=1 Tax=Ramalina farinacea TaxID=258253 RepID=A0AA43QXL1_9LECA|nr:hypothetical protein [Ramalina farinacea]